MAPVIADAELVEDAGPKLFHNHIRCPDKIKEHLPSLFVSGIQRKVSFRAVQRLD